MYRIKSRTLFSEGRISDVFQKQFYQISESINQETENFILNTNETNYINYLENKFKLDEPTILFDEVYADSFEDDVPMEYLDSFASSRLHQSKSYKREIIQYIIPCSGNSKLLKCLPASQLSLGGGGNFVVQENSLLTEIINISNNADEIKKKFENEVNGIHSNYNTLRKDIQEFNASLVRKITSEFNSRKQKLLTKNNLLSSLGVPIKKKESVPSTFSIPKPSLRERIILKPIVNEKGFKPEPSLDENTYQKILKLINDVGKNFERMPNIYEGKGEEDLRDHILMTVDPNFEMGSAAGETFNKIGKTDIQLRHDSSVLFIAECKFWSGKINYLSTITQLISYLTWRDTKASIIIFVTDKNISSIIDKVKQETQEHPNYLGYVNNSDENWFNYRFYINGDKNREVKVAVQLFHLPKIKS